MTRIPINDENMDLHDEDAGDQAAAQAPDAPTLV